MSQPPLLQDCQRTVGATLQPVVLECQHVLRLVLGVQELIPHKRCNLLVSLVCRKAINCTYLTDGPFS